MSRSTVGPLIRQERARARRSQMDLAHDVGVSPRHLSFVELGKSRPSPELLVLIADRLDVPLRSRNDWLIAAGHAPQYTETPLTEPAMDRVRTSLQTLLDAHDPNPGVVIDGRWTAQLTNEGGLRLGEEIPDHVRGEASNIFRVSLHPEGFAPRTHNFAEWSSYLLRQLDRVVTRTRDPELTELAAEIETWPRIPQRSTWGHLSATGPDVVVPWQVEVQGEPWSLYTTMSTFGTPVDITLAELTIELFFPADSSTAALLHR